MNNSTYTRISDIIREAVTTGEVWQYHIEIVEGNANGVETSDINEYVAEMLGLSTEDQNYVPDDNWRDTLVGSLLAYVRTDMKKAQLLLNPKRGIWTLYNSEVSADIAKEKGKKDSARRAAKKRDVTALRNDIVAVFRSFDATIQTTLKRAGIDKETIVQLVTEHNCTVTEAYEIFLNKA